MRTVLFEHAHGQQEQRLVAVEGVDVLPCQIANREDLAAGCGSSVRSTGILRRTGRDDEHRGEATPVSGKNQMLSHETLPSRRSAPRSARMPDAVCQKHASRLEC